MQEADLVAKMLRAVLQSNKNGVPFSCLQREYKSLTGEWIPFKQLGHASLEGYLKSIPNVVRIEAYKTGEVTCHAVVCQDTARIAQLVARQRTSKKKTGRQVHCSIRQKKIALFASVGKPKGTLRKPGIPNFTEERMNVPFPPLRNKGSCSVVRPNVSSAPYPLPSAFGNAPKEVLIQGHMTVMNRPERRVTVPAQFQRELQVHVSRNLSLDLNEMLLKNVKETRHAVKPVLPPPNTDIVKVQNRIKELLNRWSNGVCLSKMPYLYREAYGEELNAALLSQLEHWTHVCVVEKVYSGGLGNIFLYPATKTQRPPKTVLNQGGKSEPPSVGKTAEAKATPSQENVKHKIAAILSKYSSGLWANALPKVYEDTYKEPLPQDFLNNLDSLSDICSVDYISGNPQKAILYAKSKQHTDGNQNVTSKAPEHVNIKPPMLRPPTVSRQESQADYAENLTVPPLVIPAETSPSVLVVELSSTNEVVIRYVGKDYSAAQELMEDEMKDWYTHHPSVLETKPKVGQLVAALEVDDAWLRAQIVSIEDNKVKVYYVDYGFSDRVENTRIYKLAKHFYSLPFQASKCKLAGLEAFCNDPGMVKMVESQTCGKIFAVEILEKSDIPLVVLYDTSGEDDVNINTTCLNALRDRSLELRLQENTLYTNVRVTNVCSDGTLYCQVPSKGLTRLSEVLQKLENYFQHRQSTEFSVSLPYCGKICLLNCKGRWARVEITCVHSSRTLDVQFMDTGTVASVKAVELREIPSTFLRELITIPPQATKCCLADLPLNIGMWTPDAVLWLRDTVLNSPDCSIEVVKLDEKIAHVYLYAPKKSPNHSINRLITNADLWKHQKDVFLSAFPTTFLPGLGQGDMPKGGNPNVGRGFTDSAPSAVERSSVGTTLKMPPPLSLPGPQEHMDVFVSLACHPGYFVLQPWQEMHNLEILMEDMLLCYSGSDAGTTAVEKNKIYAAKVNNKWHRVLIKGILSNGLVSVYELDYGKHELVSIQNVRPLLDLFRRLPFQAITAQLAGVDCQQWSEEASVVFRNHVENKPLVAQVQAVTDGDNLWDRKVTVYLVDTSLPDTDIWIHDIMTQYCMEISKAT